MKIQIKNRFDESVIFEHEQENNSMKITVENAVKLGANLSYANLSDANLSYANLSDANLSDANLSNANLSDANLSYANLRSAVLFNADLFNADLFNADLRSADLRSANLSSADLRSADLSSADLRSADLSDADLSSADLSDADLSSANLLCKGNMKEIFTMQLDKYPIGYTTDTLQIGCQRHPIIDWRAFSDEKIKGMDTGALGWWRKWRDFIFLAIDKTVGESK